MLTEQTHAEPDWTLLPGTILDGGYQLEELLDADGNRARFRIRVLGDRSIEAVATMCQGRAEVAEDQLAIWAGVKELRSANLSVPVSSGRTQAGDVELVYVILKKPEERLSGVLGQRPLKTEEAGEVILSVARGLGDLHTNGFVHGCLSPEQVLAMDDSVLLSIDCIRRINEKPVFTLITPKYVAPESPEENIGLAADVWCLGATLFEALTQKVCGENSRDDAAKLPAPFGSIIRGCLDPDPQTRMSLADAVATFKGERIDARRDLPPVKPEISEVPKTAAVAAAAAASSSLPVMASPTLVLKATPPPEIPKAPPPSSAPPPTSRIELTRGTERRRAAIEPRQQSSRVWFYAGAALIVLLLFIWLTRPKHKNVPAVAGSTSAPAQTSSQAQQKAWETRTLAPGGTAAKKISPPPNAPRGLKESPAKAEPAAVNGSIWRVVVYTFNHSEDAAKKAATINHRHPQLQAQVFSPSGSGSPYLVIVGGQMTRQNALRFRRRVVGLGLPHDSYIQNYRQ